jgi:hypothetical protein
MGFYDDTEIGRLNKSVKSKKIKIKNYRKKIIFKRDEKSKIGDLNLTFACVNLFLMSFFMLLTLVSFIIDKNLTLHFFQMPIISSLIHIIVGLFFAQLLVWGVYLLLLNAERK